MELKQSSLSREFVRVPVAATEAGATVDPTSDTVEFAFTASGEPGPADWVVGEWETADSTYFARVLVGPGGTKELADGRWFVWLRITGATEAPVENVGTITIT